MVDISGHSVVRSLRNLRAVAALSVGGMAVAGCGVPDGSVPDGPTEITLVSHDSFHVSQSVLEDFENRHGITLLVKPVGDAGLLANQLVFTKDAPLGDVAFGIDNTYASRVLGEEVFSVSSGANANLQSPSNALDEYQADNSGRLQPVDYSEVCINFDPNFFAERELVVPVTFDDLVKPEYKDLLVVQNPATSSPGLAFLIGTISSQGEDSYVDYWKKLRANGVKVTDDWTTAYSVDFSGSSGRGPRPLVVSYLSSPYIEIPEGGSVPPTGVMTQTCTRQVEYAGILNGTKKPKEAQLVLDFLLSEEFQEDLPGQMYMYPVSPTAALPSLWEANPMPEVRSHNLTAQQIDKGRQRWIKDWAEVVQG